MPTIDDLLDAILPEIPFDGWTDAAFDAAARHCDLSAAQARALAPRGALDLAVQYHRRGDAHMVQAMQEADLSEMRYSEKVAHAIWLRLQAIDSPEAVQRATALFALPHLAPLGARLIWSTADAIWTVLGDNSDDVNWYSKRATLSAVWSSVLLYWLGDSSDGKSATRTFIDRRIDDVMRVEKAKAGIRGNALLRTAFAPLGLLTRGIRAPQPRSDLPGAQQ